MSLTPPKDRYLVEAVLRACDVMESFHEGELLRLHDLVSRTGINKTTVFRIVCTLEKRGLIEHVGQHFRSNIRPFKRGRYRFGYCALTSQTTFSRTITEGLRQAAADERIDLIVLDNNLNSKRVQLNVD